MKAKCMAMVRVSDREGEVLCGKPAPVPVVINTSVVVALCKSCAVRVAYECLRWTAKEKRAQ